MAIQENLFDVNCCRCVRLSAFLSEVRVSHPDYYTAPVPAFGDEHPGLLIVGLAPGMHGANASGRPFTGDQSGNMLFKALYKYGFSSAAESVSIDDGLALYNCRITNAVKCLPPQNRPTTEEVKQCSVFLRAELQALKKGSVVIALGSIAHAAVLRALGVKLTAHKFAHAEEHQLSEALVMIDSYHCSRYNTQTRRLTEPMFQAVFARAKELIP